MNPRLEGSSRMAKPPGHGVHSNEILNMKTLLSFACLITLLATSGCIVDDGGRGWHRHPAVIVGPPVIEVRPPAVIVR